MIIVSCSKVDFFIDGDQFIFLTAPLNGRFLSLYSIEAPVPSFGANAVGYSRVDNNGQLSSVEINQNGSNYRFEYPPQVSINSDTGSGASVKTLINGVKTVSLLDGGKGYSDTNPPTVQIQTPTKAGSSAAVLKATDEWCSFCWTTLLVRIYFAPRITFKHLAVLH